MDVQHILPIIVPGVFMQLFIQAYYIRHCWNNVDLSQRQKVYYIIAIAVFSILGAAVYLLSTGKQTTANTGSLEVADINCNFRQGIFVLLIAAFEIFSLRIIAQNIENSRYPVIITLLASCFIIMIINGLLVRRKHTILYYLLPAAQLALIIPVEYFDRTMGAPFIILAVVAGVINLLPLRLASYYSAAAFLFYLAVSVAKTLQYAGMTEDDKVSYVYANLLVFLLVYAAFYSLNKQMLANHRLEWALIKLKDQSLQLQEMSVIAERNRITGEIHDTVGHTLTSAVIAIEAGEKILHSDPKTALEKFILAKEQVKRGLHDIRSSVRTIQSGTEKTFPLQLKQLLHDIYQNTGLLITDIVELEDELLPIQQTILLQAVRECATNALKHGNSTEADLLIQEYRDRVHVTFSDNGEGTDDVRFGFGLQKMNERVQSIGGTLTVDSDKGEGFTVNLSIPVGKSKGGQA